MKKEKKRFVAREIQHFELRIFSLNSFVYYLTRGFIASTSAFNLLTLVLLFSQLVLLVFQLVLSVLQLMLLVF